MCSVQLKTRIADVVDRLPDDRAREVLDLALRLNDEPQPGSYAALLRAFGQMDPSAGIDDAAWARVEAEMIIAAPAATEKTLRAMMQSGT